MSQELARIEPEGGQAIVKSGQVDVVSVIQAVMKGGVTKDNVEAVKELLAIQERQQEKDARQQFVEAFARVRSKTKVINAVKGIPDKNGNVKWYYAPLEDLQDEIEPTLREEGLELRFDSRREGPTAQIVIGICIIMHAATGYSERAECGVNAANCEGGDLGAIKKAKRGALTAMLGLRTRHDDDARMLGDCVSPEQAAELQRRLKAVGRDEKRFLAFAKAATWAEIRQGRYGELDAFLRKAEREQAAKAPKVERDPDTGDIIPANLYGDEAQRPK